MNNRTSNDSCWKAHRSEVGKHFSSIQRLETFTCCECSTISLTFSNSFKFIFITNTGPIHENCPNGTNTYPRPQANFK